ncbi:MAG: SpoIIE family protein phosphatase [Acidimicrobiia bacterium]|nr:SpoIIE family protein phosphatase [Acidimicrobiia bacterium]
MLDPYETTTDPVLARAAEHLRLALDAGELGTWRWVMATKTVEWDERLEALFGMAPDEFDGQFDTWIARIHPDDRAAVADGVQQSVATAQPYTVHHRVLLPDGSIRWIEGRGQPTFDEAGEVDGTIGCAHDVTDRMRTDAVQHDQIARMAELAEIERLHRERLEFLLQINDALASTTDRRQIMRRVTAAAVPRLGEWCIIHVVIEPGTVPEVEAAHTDPEMLSTARRLAKGLAYDPDARVGAAAVIRTGQRQFYPSIAVDQIPGVNDLARELLARVGLHSTIIVPLIRHGRTYGAMTFARTGNSRSYTHDDLALADAVGGRIAAALENARLIEQQTQIARVLQASLLPAELPDLPGFEVAVRYTASGEGSEVGGDFYDIFGLAGHSWGIAIGDVCGKGPEAAALTGLARHTIRASAWRGDQPDAVLTRLNEAVHRSDSGSFCTALFGVLIPAQRTFTAAAGGHPLPILVHPDGRAEAVLQPGMLLGAFPVQRSTVHSIELPPGAMLVLYTDGVTDVPPPNELSPADFLEIVQRCAREADNAEHMVTLLDGTLDALRPAVNRTDDIALMVLRSVD